MTYIQNHTLLGSLQDYNRALKELHREVRERNSNPIQTQLVDYFENVQNHIDEVLRTLQEDMSEADAETFNQYTPETHPLDDLEKHLPMPEESAAWIEWVLQRQQHMVEWCENLVGQSISSRTTEVFGEIAEHLKEVNRKLASDTQPYLRESGQPST